MSDDQPGPTNATNMPRRMRDMFMIVGFSIAVLLLLALTSALGWVEAITASIVLLAASMAYVVGTAQPEKPVAAADVRSVPDGYVDERDMVPALLNTLPIPALHVSPDGRISAANAQAHALFRIRADQRSLAAAVIRHPALLTALTEALERPAVAQRLEVELGAANDRFWLAHVVPFENVDGGALLLLEDHTALHRAERARADFLANASHELRTPLTSLAGFIETMRGPAREDTAAWDRYLEIMFDQTERMKRLIADLLSLSRIEFSEHRPPEQSEDIAEQVLLAIAAMRPVAADRKVTLAYDGPEHGLKTIAEADEVAQVAQNLLANAVKYSSSGAAVHVSCGRADSLDLAQSHAGRQWSDAERITILPAAARAPSQAIWLRVEDSGPGIEREHLPRLGQRFYRVDESRGGDVSGTGLGLAIVKHIMTRHRGGLIVESTPGRGSAFGVWFPVAGERAASTETSAAGRIPQPVVSDPPPMADPPAAE